MLAMKLQNLKENKMNTLNTLRGLMAFIMILPTMAFAHSKVNSSNPENGAQMPAGLEVLELGFSKSVRVTRFGLHLSDEDMAIGEMTDGDTMEHDQSAAEVLDAKGDMEISITSDLPNGFGTELTVTFEALEAGIYHYAWIAVAQDGHLMEGQGHFEVLAAE